MAKYKLGEICEFYSGTGFPVTYQGKAIGDFPFYKVGDIANNVVAGNVYLSLCNNYISNQDALEIKGTIIPKDTVVFAKIGEALKLNRRALTSCNCLIDNNAMGIAPKRKFLQTGYFFYFMKNLKLQNFAESTTVPSVRKSKLEQIEIETPPLNTQNEVERTLDKISSLITIRQHQLQKLDELIKARFVELFGSVDDNQKDIKTIRVGDACTLINGRAFKPDEWSTEGLPIVRIQNLNSEEAPFNYYSGEVKSQHLINSGDLLFSWSGTPGTSFGAFFWRRGKAALNQHIFKVIPNCDYNLFFLQYALNERLNFIISRAHGGVGLQHITKKELDEVLLFQPGINEQNDFATFVEQVDKSKVAVQKSLDEAQLLFDSLMQQYFG